MKRILISFFFILATMSQGFSQNFISKATIEFEVKTNIKKTMGNDSWDEMIKAQMPDFKTGYYLFTFADNKSIYKFSRWDETKKIPEWLRKSDEENTWYFDHNISKFNMQKNVFGSNFNLDDSIPAIQWKLSNENRMIAGFNCRKAVGVIMDSVYVFAFFTEEIMIPGGPCSINGLPGMILGLTIPRLYTSFIATKIMVNDVNVAAIKPTTAKKYFTNTSLRSELLERSKDWGSDDDPDQNKWRDQFRWNALL
ncbi:MAG TPA: GLPGLI family protein [Ferruginibacter sp.]|nr:GLPGLI family protein [Ferruginibacter sp.]